MIVLKNFFLFFSLFLFSSKTICQNLVPNPSFEEYITCPEFLGSVKSFNAHTSYGILKEWLANPPNCTPDYFHPCGKRDFKVPRNLCGNMPAFEGEGYVGMIWRIGEVHVGHPSDIIYREHITAQLHYPLQKNFQYVVKFHIVLSEFANYAIANVGALFTEEPLIIKENIAYNPQILHESYIAEKKQWVTICDTFRAKGNEKFITIGNFDSHRTKKIKKITNETTHYKKFNYNRAYYYIDDVSVEELDQTNQLDKPISFTKNDVPEFETSMGILKKDIPYRLKNIYFAFDEANLLPKSFEELDKLVQILKQYPNWNIELIGHTDSIGTTEKNQLLSEKRSQSVAQYLIEKGIKTERITTKGFGETYPMDENETEKGRQNNRRVEFILK